jgi:transcriptional regulator with XRE-family HTH domain
MVKISIKAARVNVGLSQKEAAERLNVSAKTLGNWENGTTYPQADKILDICELYGVSYDHLNFLPSDSLLAKN